MKWFCRADRRAMLREYRESLKRSVENKKRTPAKSHEGQGIPEALASMNEKKRELEVGFSH